MLGDAVGVIGDNNCPLLLFVKGGRPLSAWIQTNIAESHAQHLHFRWPHAFEVFDPSKDELVALLADYLNAQRGELKRQTPRQGDSSN